MKLYQVRKGQFVYYNNELHKIYGVKPMYKQSVHLIRLRDLTQHLTKAVSVERYKPKDLDSFVFNHKVYTLRNDRKAEAGDYILINNPMPDSLDTYSLNEIDLIETADNKGVITSNSHGIKHNEYLLMVPGRANGSTPIDYQDIEKVDEESLKDLDPQNLDLRANEVLPSLGDVYKKKDNHAFFEAMVVAIKDQTVYLGGGIEITADELMINDKWEFQYNLLDK
ncbi:hypothetical protein [Metabacillus sediminilitoris]|uniref:Uncharacterized protein n=1 Tax=Metabacillus sediminilitoris TaxID=2567941 RepID=A0A4S4BSB2_9BACI|nr:hypothetical protein [Metabacillus sediminilitoris]QGQ48520.1 hypothetical protein GMB29_26590 [Metabacillus sediminilitoris]THF77906.1 hypothetical protein E6W99_17680 [Metabacillus sediminilitoris]